MKSKREVLELLKSGKALGLAAGCVATNAPLIRRCDAQLQELDFICTKSFQISPNTGNRAPIILEPQPYCLANAVGLRNMGMKQELQALEKLRAEVDLRLFLIVSLAGSSIEEFATLLKAFSHVADAFELNFSCPHAEGYGASIGRSAHTVTTYLQTLRCCTERPIFVKLTPEAEDIGTVAQAALAAEADGLSAINTVGPVCYWEKESEEPFLSSKDHRGGMSGGWIHKQACASIAAVRRAIGNDYPLIGSGGVNDHKNYKNILQVGASAVAVGSIFANVPSSQWSDLLGYLKKEKPSPYCFSTRLSHNYLETRPTLKINNCGYWSLKPHQFLKTEQQLHWQLKLHETLKDSGMLMLWQPGEQELACPYNQHYLWIEKKKNLQLNFHKPLYLRYALRQVSRIEEIPYVLKQVNEFTPNLANVFLGWGVQAPWLLSLPLPQNSTVFCSAQQGYELSELIAGQGCQLHVCTRALEMFQSFEIANDTNYYLAAALPLLRQLSRILLKKNVEAKRIFWCPPRQFLCGIGLCGACQLDGLLPCNDGLFLKLSWLENELKALIITEASETKEK